MKKWTLHTSACIINAIAATAFMGILIYEIFADPVSFFKNDGLLLF